MNAYVCFSAGVFLGLGLIWNREGWLNIALKLLLFGFGVWGIVERFGRW